jgi:branched-chain amino acid transport system substrate-binding protein
MDGVEAAAKVIDNAGGVLGQKLNVVPVNTESDPVDAVTATRKMLAVDGCNVVQGLTAADWPGALPVIEQSHMVVFDEVADPTLDKVSNPYEFRGVASDGLEGAAMAVAAWHLGYRRVALAFQAASDAQTLIPSLTGTAKNLHLQIVANPSLPVSVPAYTAEVQTIVASHPDAILMQLEPEPSGIFFQSLEALGGSNIPVIVSDVGATAEWIKSVGSSITAKQTVSVTPSAETQGPGYSTFNDTFSGMFGSSPLTYSASGYDSMMVAALAMDAAHSTDPTVYKNYVTQVTTPGSGIQTVYSYADGAKLLSEGKRIKYFGIGSPMTYNANHDITTSFAVVQVATSGTQTVVWPEPASVIAQYLGTA